MLAVLVGLVWLWSPEWKTKHDTFHITAGSEEGLRHLIAVKLAEFSTEEHVGLEVIPTSGSRDALTKVNSGELHFALAQGGLPSSKYPDIRQVAVLHIEPLHLLVKPEVEGEGSVDHYTLTELSERYLDRSNLRFNVSTSGSGTNALATVLLQFFNLQAGVDYESTRLSYSELMDPEMPFTELPDAVFTVSSLPSPVASYLINEKGYRPVELAMADAFRIDWSRHAAGHVNRVLRQHVVASTIPAFTYQVNPPVPRVAIPTLGTRLHLVAHRDIPADAVEHVVDAIYDSPFASSAEPKLVVNLLQTSAEFPLHPGAADYLQKKTPIITEHVVAMTEQVLAIMGTIFGAALFLWQGMLFARRRRRDRQFLVCIERVGEIEQRSLEYERDPAMTIDSLVDLQGELNQIKSDMVQQFQRGDIDGADTLSGFLMHVNDANENLTRLCIAARNELSRQNSRGGPAAESKTSATPSRVSER